jgi:CheY-like chemotaxis protein
MSEGRFVLVVDDDAPSLKLMERYLGALGYESLTASSGKKGLEILHDNVDAIGLVLLDLAMPGMSGYDVCRAIRDDSTLAHLPIVAITGNVELDYMSHAIEAGADHLTTKPFSRASLEAALDDYFAV